MLAPSLKTLFWCVGLGAWFLFPKGEVAASTDHPPHSTDGVSIQNLLPLMPGLKVVPHQNGYAPPVGGQESIGAHGFHGTMAESVIVAEGGDGVTEEEVIAYYRKMLPTLGWSDEGQNTFSHMAESVTIEAFDATDGQGLRVYFHYHQKMRKP